MFSSPRELREQLHKSYLHSHLRRYKMREISFWQMIWLYKKHLGVIAFGFVALLVLIALITYLLFIQVISSKDRIVNNNNTGLTLMDRDSKVFFTFNQPKAIKYINLPDIPIPIQKAVIASEDKNFYTNPGISFSGILRAIVVDITTGHLTQGGSTITQELVRTALLNQNKNFLRKYQEIILAYELSKKYSKNDILEMYLNSVYFGEGAFGIENAAQAYFGEHSSQLDLAQSALLTGLLPAPSLYSPLSNNPDIAKKHQETVLNLMVQQGYITQDQADQAINEKLTYNPIKQTPNNTLAPHFALFVKDYLTKKYGEEQILRSGFKVTTTLNADWQQYAEKAVKNQVSYLVYDKATNGAAVALDPKTGQILVMVGSEDWNNEKFGKTNMSISPRQPGSSFKPIIYSDAFREHLITPATVLQDKLTDFGGGYKPLDYDKSFRGPVTVRRALANSLNIPAVEVMQKVGVSESITWGKNLGITTLKDPSNYGLSLVLGAAEVPLVEMTNVYATFADYGTQNPITPILQVQDKFGKTVEKYEPNPKNVMDEGVAYLISSILSDNKTRAEEFGNALTISRPAAVKTGTTTDFKDALTLGYTPSLAIGVWVGNNDDSPMDNIAGSLGAAPIWRLLMEHFLAGSPVEQFQKPSDVIEVASCPYKGLQSNLATASATMEFYLEGTEPKNGCENPTNTPGPKPTDSPTPKPSDTPNPTQQPTDTPMPTVQPTTQVQPTTVITLPIQPSATPTL